MLTLDIDGLLHGKNSSFLVACPLAIPQSAFTEAINKELNDWNPFVWTLLLFTDSCVCGLTIKQI